MKKYLSVLTMAMGFAVSIALMAFGLQQKGNEKNGKGQQGQAKGNQKGNDNKGKPDKVVVMQQDKGNKGNGNGNNGRENGNSQANGNANKGKGNDNGKGNDIVRLNDNNGNNGNRRAARINLPGNNNWYSWTDANFRDRKEVKNKGKVTICHKFNSNEEPVSITVSENALKAHMAHGDVVGDCPVVRNSTWSDIFRRRRADYYNDLYYGQDQYNYSNSILDYALMRLTNSRLQLDQMRINNAPQADIERRQAAILGLEQNASVLETLLGVAGQYLANRLL